MQQWMLSSRTLIQNGPDTCERPGNAARGLGGALTFELVVLDNKMYGDIDSLNLLLRGPVIFDGVTR